MHQTFYIDIDEEVISVINKIRKAKTKKVYLVVPQRALIIQSIVNLKLLKKEADTLRKEITLVTQDKHGTILAERAELNVQEETEGITEENIQEGYEPKIKKSKKPTKGVKQKKRLKSLGSDGFFSGGKIEIEEIESEASERKDETRDDEHSVKLDVLPERKKNHSSNKKEDLELKLDPKKEMELEKLFGSKEGRKDNNEEVLIPGKVKKGVATFIFIGILVILGSLAYIFLPTADLKITLAHEILNQDIDIEGKKNVSVIEEEEQIIPIKIIEEEGDLSLSYSATGEKTISDQKARGSIVIYNEFSEDSQPLVATTRLLSSEGELFRLVKGINVPGMTEVDGKLQPGIIEAEVIADKEGSEFNIEPTEFSIPGFKGSPKYNKFYGKSSSKMIGGGSEGVKIKVISEEDIKEAKNKTEETLRKKIESQIKEKLTDSMIILEDGIEREILSSKSFVDEGVATDAFDYSVEMKVKAFAFSENDLREVIEAKFESDSEDKKMTKVKIEYGQLNADFENESLTVKIHSKALIQPKFDRDKFLKEILGKNEDDIYKIVNANNVISKIEISFWPEILTVKMPRFSSRINLDVNEPNFE